MESVYFHREHVTESQASYLAARLTFQVYVEGKPLRQPMLETFVVDTGAGFTIIRGKVLAANGIGYESLKKPISRLTIGGYGWKSNPYVLDIYFPKINLKILNACVDPYYDGQNPAFSFLGWDFIDHFQFCFQPDLDSVKFTPWHDNSNKHQDLLGVTE